MRPLLACALSLAACATDLSQRDAHDLVARGALLLDVRSPSEFADGHPPEAHNLPVEDLQRHLAELPRDRDIVVYCHTGARAAAATAILRRAGFRVHNLGSIGHWYVEPPTRAQLF